MHKKKLAIIGAGGIGAYFATKLLLSEYVINLYEIVVIQRGLHYRQIMKSGLNYITKNNSYNTRPGFISDNPFYAGVFDIVIVCTKSYDLEAALYQIKDNVTHDTVILSTLNGLNIAERMDAILPSPSILTGCIYLSAYITEPGTVKQIGGAGDYFFGPLNGFTEPFLFIENLFKEAGIKASLCKNIALKLWEKYIFVCSLATITTYTRQSIGAIIENPEWKELWIRLMLEIFMIARQKEIYLPTSIMQDCVVRASGAPYETKTSMQLDFESGKEMNEMDIFTNYIIKLGEETGAPVFVHRMIQEKIMNQFRI